MKLKLLAVAAAVMAALSLPHFAGPGQLSSPNFTVYWYHPTNWYGGNTFNIYASTSITNPVSAWTNFFAISDTAARQMTNQQPVVVGTNYVYQASFTIPIWGQSDVYLALTSSNIVGESSFSSALPFRLPRQGSSMGAFRTGNPNETIANSVPYPPVPLQ